MTPAYNFAYLNEQTKRMIRRAILKAVAVPGYQVPFASREMPMPYGWGTGAVQVTASLLKPDDVLKVIDQGADDTTNAVSIRKFFVRTAGIATTEDTRRATVIQTRHRIPETLGEGQILVLQVPIPEPLRFLEPRETETRKMHALAEYGVMHVKLYEDIARFGHIATTYAYPARVAGRYVLDPSPIPKFDNPKLDRCPALQLFGAGRARSGSMPSRPIAGWSASISRISHPSVQRFDHPCALCGGRDSFLDEIIMDDRGTRMSVCSDTDHCSKRRAAAWAAAGSGDDTSGRSTAARRRGARQALWRAGRLPRCELRAVGGRGAGDRRRVRARGNRRCSNACRCNSLHRADGFTIGCATSGWWRRSVERGGAPLPHAHRLGLVHQDPREGLRMGVSAGANIGERLMAVGERHYGRIRVRRSTGSTGSRSRPTGSMTVRLPIPAACGSACRSPAIWSPGRGSSSWTSRPAARRVGPGAAARSDAAADPWIGTVGGGGHP